MIQNIIKILTLGFFVSMISGFVLYRSGYFDSIDTTRSLQSSPNGGELLAVNVDQDTNRIPQINQADQEPIMPSSKLLVPVIDPQKLEQLKPKRGIMPSSKSEVPLFKFEEGKQKEIMPSSKSMTHPIDLTPNQISEKERKSYKVQPELRKDSSTKKSEITEEDATGEKVQSNSSEGQIEETSSDVTAINWRGIWIGLLGILFVAIGSIVYFKRRSK